ncbi:MAG TPA: HAD family phosphatase [Acidimicrobiales bacterium]|jgi:putative hydrolase of the HAD superfamily|nr:HAD family phosphatase [Acidimicrobiales bacterium]
MAVTAVAFDFGGVLTVPPFAGLEAYAREVGLPGGLLTSLFTGNVMAQVEVGAVSSRQFFKHVCIECSIGHGVAVDIHALADAAAQGQRLEPEMLSLVDQVQRRCATALLTNNVKEATWRDDFPHHLFDVEVDSSDVGLRKPDPAVYRLLLDRLGRDADEVAFFDDLEQNLPAALALGIHAIHFTGVDGCRAALADLGVLETVAP